MPARFVDVKLGLHVDPLIYTGEKERSQHHDDYINNNLVASLGTKQSLVAGNK